MVVGSALLAACAGLERRPTPDEIEAALEQKQHMAATMKAYLGTRYHLGGTGKGGIDCSGFTQKVYQSAGVTLPRTAHQQWDEGRKVKRSELQFGDLVFFNTKRLATSQCAGFFGAIFPSGDMPVVYGVTHTGIYVGDGRFIHASPSQGVSYARLEDDYWRERYLGARRLLMDLPE